MSKLGRLSGKVVAVTGAAGGIGQQLAFAVAEQGASVALLDVSSTSSTLKALQDAGNVALSMKCDVANESSVSAAFSQILEDLGPVDVLVNNAAVMGAGIRKPFDEIPQEEWDLVMNVNVKGVWNCSKAAVAHMRDSGGGRIINISSMTVWLGMPYLVHYSASKGAVLTFTRCLARELQGSGINVNAITPGWHETESAASLAGDDLSETRNRMLDRQIVKRTGNAGDINGAVLFLASADSDFVTGQTINVDGGLYHH